MQDEVLSSVISEVSAILGKSASTQHRMGELSEVVFNKIKHEAIKEINRPFNELIETKSLSFCRKTPPLIYPKSVNEAKNLWKNNYTISLQHLNLRNSFFHKVCSEISMCLKNKITLSVYLSQSESQSFSWHTDEWENLCIQIEGEKHFEIKKKKIINSHNVKHGEWLRMNPLDIHRAFSPQLSMHLSFARHLKYKNVL